MSDTTSGAIPFASMFSDPKTMAILGAAGAASQMAMPTRVPVPFGAVLGATAGGFGQGARAAYGNQLAQAQAQEAQMKNALTASMLPVQLAQNQQMLNFYQHPEILGKLLGGQPTVAGGGGNSSPGAASTYGGSGAPAASSPYAPFISRTAMGMGIPPVLANAYLQQESGLGTDPKAGTNVGQITFKTAQNPGYGMTPLSPDDMKDPQKNIAWSLAYMKKAGEANGVTNWNDPSQWGIALRAYNGGGDPNYVQNVARYLPQGTQISDPGASFKPYQVAQAGSGAIPGPPSSSAPSAPSVANGSVPTPSANLSSGDALSIAMQYAARANRMETIQKLGIPAPLLLQSGIQYEDPTVLRQAAQKYRDFAFAGPTAAAEARGKAQNSLQMDRFGNAYVMGPDNQFHYVGRGNEIKPVYQDGKIVYGNVGGEGIGAQPPPGGFAAPQEAPNIPEATIKQNLQVLTQHGIAAPMPGSAAPPSGAPAPNNGAPAATPAPAPQPGVSQHPAPGISTTPLPGGGVAFTDRSQQQAETYKADQSEANTAQDEINSLNMGMQRALEARRVIAQLPQAGANGTSRALIANYVATYMPQFAQDWAQRAAKLPDAALAQELAKLQIANAGSQEQDMHARPGVQLTNIMMKANPGMELQPEANRKINNMQLVTLQMHKDYDQGLVNWVADKGAAYNPTQQGGEGAKDYVPSSEYDKQWNSANPSAVYQAALLAMNGEKPEAWTKGLTSKAQVMAAMDVIRRIDPTNNVLWYDGPHPAGELAQK